LIVAQRRTIWALEANEATVVLDTADYNRKISALLEDHTYIKLKKDSL
jgi:hypothetical protein